MTLLPRDPKAGRSTRGLRYARREVLWHVSARPRLRACGRHRTSPIVELGVGQLGAGFGGVQSCGSVWSCPVCAAIIRQGRAVEVEQAALRWLERGGTMLFLTLTMRHQVSDDLADTLDAVLKGFGSARRSKVVRGGELRTMDLVNTVGFIRATEVTYGVNGWHPHLHVLLFCDGPVSDDMLDDFRERFFTTWAKSFERRGFKRPSRERGIRVERVARAADVGRYVAKVQDEHSRERGIGLEMTRHDLKQGRRRESITPMQLLDRIDDARDHGTRKAWRRLVATWREYEAATAGRRAIVFSRGLRALLGVTERSDEEIIDQVENEDRVVVAQFVAHEWRATCRRRLQGRLLDLAEAGDRETIARLVDEAVTADAVEWGQAYAEHEELRRFDAWCSYEQVIEDDPPPEAAP